MSTIFSKVFRIGAIMAASAGLATSAHASILADGSFEIQGAASTTNYCYFNQALGGNPACSPTGAWSGTAGFVIDTAGGWPGIPAADGRYFGFVQGTSYLSQAFSVAAAGSYLLSWSEAGRYSRGNTNGQQTYNVNLTDLGTNLTTTLYTSTTGDFQNWGPLSKATTLGAGNYILTFQGTATTDSTSFIDAVSLSSAVPEPATWAMMVVGIGLAGFALRRRPAVRPAAA